MSQTTRTLDRGRFMRVGLALAGPDSVTTDPLPGIRRVAWTGASDVERHLQFGDDENHLEAKVPTYTGEIQVEDGENLTIFLQYATGDPNLIEVDLAKLNAAQPWGWVNIMDRRRTIIRHSTIMKRMMWSGLPNEFEVDDVNIMSFPFESPRCWKIRGYAVMAEEFTGDDITTIFNLTEDAVPLSDGSYAFVVAVEDECNPGVMIELEDGFTVTSTTLTFTDAPGTGLSIQILYLYYAGCVPGGS